jgi:hypothetical protein
MATWRIKSTYRKPAAGPACGSGDGVLSTMRGLKAWYIPGSFRFCLNCGVVPTQPPGKDSLRLTSLSGEGRSSATTMLTLARPALPVRAGSPS